MLKFDPTTTSGNALASLFRTWCELRGDDPEAEVDGGDLVTAVAEMFQDLDLDVGGPASQVDQAAGHSVYTVFGLTRDAADELLVAGVIPGEHADAVVILKTSEEHFRRWADTFVAESADAAASMARSEVEDGDGDEPEYDDVTPGPWAYPQTLLDDVREALVDWFQRNPEHVPPRAVTFDVTTDYDDGPAWDTSTPTFHYDGDPDSEERHDIPTDKSPAVDFERTPVADALVELSEAERPRAGDTLRIALRPSA